jgi:hypothetical protein
MTNNNQWIKHDAEQEPVSVDETAWLVEAVRDTGIVYLNLFGWDADVGEALRFSRESDAKRVITQLPYLMPVQIKLVSGIKASVHMWCDSKLSTTPPQTDAGG